MLFNQRKAIEKVFTPRSSEVNPDMYVERSHHEERLRRALKRNSHTLIYGDSGNGKSWLYKKVLASERIPFVVANCGSASRKQSIQKEICDVLIDPGTVQKLGFNETKSAGANAYILKSEIGHKAEYLIYQDDPLLYAFRLFSKKYSGNKIIVLDNLEAIFSTQKLMDELADILLLLDDTRYAEHKVKFLIVGTQTNILRYFRETKTLESVSNRIQEIPRVSNLNEDQVAEVIAKGFEQLKIPLSEASRTKISNHVYHVTLGIAQRIHEYCESLAYEVSDNNWIFKEELLKVADKNWLLEGLNQSYQVIENRLNSRETTVGRRNQVIYCIARVKSHQFDSTDIDKIIRREFPESIPKTNMGIGSILSELSSGNAPLLDKNQTTNSYSVRDPRYLMCIRIILYKNPLTRKIIKRNLKR